MEEQKMKAAENGSEKMREEGNIYSDEKDHGSKLREDRERRFFTIAFASITVAIIIWIFIGIKML